MILIADSGSTKTDWLLIPDTGNDITVRTQGINPFHQTDGVIDTILRGELLPSLPPACSPLHVYFYGSGCDAASSGRMQSLLRAALPAATVSVSSDLLGAARALCGASRGVACIIGTGVNSCLYDGSDIVQNTPPLGYILGDEGSGAVLGRLFINALYKGFLPQELRPRFERHLGMTYNDIITRVYREPMANRFLASTAPFIRASLHIPAVRQIVVGNFRDFFRRNVVQYHAAALPVNTSAALTINAVGSIAFYFQEQLRDAAAAEGYTVGTVLRSPMPGLAAYHK